MVAVLSMILLKRRYDIFQGFAMLTVIFGLFIVAKSGTYDPTVESSNVLMGVICMLCGQICHGS